MTQILQIGPFGLPDILAFGVLLAAWLGLGWRIEHPPAGHPSVAAIAEKYRREWMQQLVTRQPRIFDANIIDNLRQGTAFFVSASMIAIGGGVALIGNPGPLLGLTHDLAQTASTQEFQLRILPTLGFLANSLLKFIWAHRLFGYCAILMAAVPNDHTDPMAGFRAAQAAEVNIHGARNFNRGMRSIYFALGALGALIGPWALLAATVTVSGVIVRREFASQSREIMLQKGPSE